MQFKALDNVLQTISRDTGQKEALSYRCADIDRWVAVPLNAGTPGRVQGWQRCQRDPNVRWDSREGNVVLTLQIHRPLRLG